MNNFSYCRVEYCFVFTANPKIQKLMRNLVVKKKLDINREKDEKKKKRRRNFSTCFTSVHNLERFFRARFKIVVKTWFVMTAK